MLPLKLFVIHSGQDHWHIKNLCGLPSATVLLIIPCRSKLLVPNSICGWWSIRATTQLSGVSKPFSLRFALPLLEVISTPFFESVSLVNSGLPITMVADVTLDRFLIVAIHAWHLRHLQPNALSEICSQQLIFGVGECERSDRSNSAG